MAELDLGDIIKLVSSNTELNDKIYLITYLDDTLLQLTGEDKTQLEITIEDGNLSDETISEIQILSKAPTPSFARQNNFLPGEKISFTIEGVDYKGVINSLNEDQIEIKLEDMDEFIYIDFAYKGIPRDIPFENLKILKHDELLSHVSEGDESEKDVDAPLDAGVLEEEKDDDSDEEVEFGEDLKDVHQVVEVPEHEKKYSITKQTNDLLNEILSTIPSDLRTTSTLNKIHEQIERYVQLRNKFSIFDDNQNVEKQIVRGDNYKPLLKTMTNMEKNIEWIVPIAKNIKKIYELSSTEAETVDIEDIAISNTNEDLLSKKEIIENFKTKNIPEGENPYHYLLTELESVNKPYENPDDDSIPVHTVGANITAYVNNYDNITSTAISYENLDRKRFLIQKYNLGARGLNVKRIRGGGNVISSINITEPEKIYLDSILVKPKKYIDSARITLPGTQLLTRVNLEENVNNVSINQDTELVTSEKILENNLKTYSLIKNTKLDEITPNITDIINVMNPEIEGMLNMNSIIGELEPFLVYSDDVTVSTYKTLVDLIAKNIDMYNAYNNDIKRDVDFKYKEKIAFDSKSRVNLLDIIREDLRHALTEKYGYSDGNTTEFLNHIYKLDNGKLYAKSIASLNTDLIMSDGFESLKKYYETLSQQQTEQETNKCNKNVITKRYNSVGELEQDNDKVVFYDNEFDTTNYFLKKEYEQELELLEKRAAIEFLKEKILDNTSKSEVSAEREAQSIYNEQKAVVVGEYAILITSLEDGNTITYYKRTLDNKWVLDESVTQADFNISNSMFCDINASCIAVDDRCKTFQESRIDLNKKNIETIMYEFTEKTKHMQETIKDEFEKALENIHLLRNKHFMKEIKYDIEKYKLGLTIPPEELVAEKSPFLNLLNLILQQNDFIKKQNDIIMFVDKFTQLDESGWWYNCVQTGINLLPSFVYKLANVVQSGGDYLLELRKISAQQGVHSGDKEAVIDKHTGWVITNIDFSTEEGFTEEGFKMKTRDVIDVTQNVDLEEGSKDRDKRVVYIEKILKALAGFLSINTEEISEFVVGNTIMFIPYVVPSKESYARQTSKPGKKYDSYEVYHDKMVFYITMAFTLIGIQTNTPTLKAVRTYPGCKKSFDGYPTFDNTDKSGLDYIVCVVDKIKKGWLISRTKLPKIKDHITNIIEKIRKKTTIIKDRKALYEEYKKTHIEEHDISVEHDIRSKTFLPSLEPITITSLDYIDKSTIKTLHKYLQSGDKRQLDGIDNLSLKIIGLSLLFQGRINKVVEKNIEESRPLLMNGVKRPFIENVCCIADTGNVFKFFSKKDPTIIELNNQIKFLEKEKYAINKLSRARILFSQLDTRTKYPKNPAILSESTILKAFIHYCKYNTDLPVASTLAEICSENKTSVEDAKSAGIELTSKSLEDLMNVVNTTNIIDMDLSDEYSFDINTIIEDTDEVNTYIKKVLGTDKESSKFSKRIESLNSLLVKTIQKMIDYVKNYLVTNKTTKRDFKQYSECLEKMLSKSSYNKHIVKNAISNITCLYPNMIINEVAFKRSSIPNHWKLSYRHTRDIQDILASYYKKLDTFYGDTTIVKYLQSYVENAKNISDITNELYATTGIPNDTLDLLMKYFLMKSLYDLAILEDTKKLPDVSRLATIDEDEVDEVPAGAAAGVEESKEVDAAFEITDAHEKSVLSNKLSQILITFVKIACNDNKAGNMSYDSLTERITKSKEKEKNLMVARLTAMSQEDRNIEKDLKRNRLGTWATGQQKGFRIYQGSTYDQEREAMEDMFIAEQDNADDVTQMQQDVYTRQDEEEAYDISNLGEDGDLLDELDYDEREFEL